MINIPMLFLMDRIFGMYGLAWSQLVSDVIVAFLSWVIYRVAMRRINRERGSAGNALP